MTRPLRLEFAGAMYHITARGNARESIYSNDARCSNCWAKKCGSNAEFTHDV